MEAQLSGTQLYNWLYRLLGAKVGRSVLILGSGFEHCRLTFAVIYCSVASLLHHLSTAPKDNTIVDHAWTSGHVYDEGIKVLACVRLVNIPHHSWDRLPSQASRTPPRRFSRTPKAPTGKPWAPTAWPLLHAHCWRPRPLPAAISLRRYPGTLINRQFCLC
jgi:hypothetical protein